MTRFLSIPLFLLACFSAFAQTAPEAPVEKASPVVVIGFLVIFVGGCVGYFVYLMWSKRKGAKDK